MVTQLSLTSLSAHSKETQISIKLLEKIPTMIGTDVFRVREITTETIPRIAEKLKIHKSVGETGTVTINATTINATRTTLENAVAIVLEADMGNATIQMTEV